MIEKFRIATEDFTKQLMAQDKRAEHHEMQMIRYSSEVTFARQEVENLIAKTSTFESLLSGF